MRMARLITLNWGTIDHRDWPLADATLLTGESGSGKSTLLDAMQAVLTAASAGRLPPSTPARSPTAHREAETAKAHRG